MDFFRQHILSIVAFWPLAGMFVLLFINKENKTLIRWWANLVVFTGFLISLPLWFWFDFDNSDKMQFVEQVHVDSDARRRLTTSASTASRCCWSC